MSLVLELMAGRADVFLMNVRREKEEKCQLDLPNKTGLSLILQL